MSNPISKKLFHLSGISVLLFTILATHSTNAAAAADQRADRPGAKKASGLALPLPDTYSVDPVHSFSYFAAWHHIVGVVRGRFDKVTGTITVSEDPAACAVDIAIDAASISTQEPERDDDLRGPDFFDAKKFPTMTYRGRGIHHVSGDSWRMDGSLTIRGVEKLVPLTFTFKGAFPDTKPGKPVRVAFHGLAATKRADFGMTRDNLMELGASPTGKPDVEIQIDVEADSSTLRTPAK